VARLEATLIGRVLLTVAMVVLVAALLVWNAPAGPAVAPLKPWSSRVLLPLGLDQDWSVFAPEPRAFTVGVYAVVTRADGSTIVWHPPAKGLFFAPYRTYRWQKYVERLRADDESQLWDPGARAIAREVGGDVRKVVLWRTFQNAVTPGTGGHPKNQSYAFYTLLLP
jgi:hypothetical protein